MRMDSLFSKLVVSSASMSSRQLDELLIDLRSSFISSLACT